MNDKNNTGNDDKLSFGQLIGSIMAGAIGVQSGKNRERDFSSGSLLPFVIGGLIFTALFIGSIIALVQYLLHSA
ncbi:MAG TPA: DUF2970 domain-containing protein [Pseudomonadales bacterium]